MLEFPVGCVPNQSSQSASLNLATIHAGSVIHPAPCANGGHASYYSRRWPLSLPQTLARLIFPTVAIPEFALTASPVAPDSKKLPCCTSKSSFD